MTVQLYSDSLALTRPGVVGFGERYIDIFEQWLGSASGQRVFLINRARRGNTIDKLYEVYLEDDEYLPEQRDILILHEGICDCAPRPVAPTVRRLVSKLPGSIRKKVISWIHHNRARLLNGGFRYHLTDEKEYRQILTQWLTHARDKYAGVYVLNIAPTNAGTESHSPGLGASIETYNRILASVIEEVAGKDGNIKLLDVHGAILSDPEGPDACIVKEDGHHITRRGHMVIGKLLIEAEKIRGGEHV
jgi:lysophospholipase L1-like esterase